MMSLTSCSCFKKCVNTCPAFPSPSIEAKEALRIIQSEPGVDEWLQELHKLKLKLEVK